MRTADSLMLGIYHSAALTSYPGFGKLFHWRVLKLTISSLATSFKFCGNSDRARYSIPFQASRRLVGESRFRLEARQTNAWSLPTSLPSMVVGRRMRGFAHRLRKFTHLVASDSQQQSAQPLSLFSGARHRDGTVIADRKLELFVI